MSSHLDLDVLIDRPEGGEFEGRCLDIEPLGDEMLASVEFPAASGPLIRLGEGTELQFRAPGLESSLYTEAVAVLRTDDATRRCYCFRGNITKRAFMHLLNQRRSPRVRLDPAKALRVSILDLGDPPPEAMLYDVSAMGLSILLDPAFEQQLFERSQLRVAVRLPGEEEAVEMLANIRHRRLLASSVLYGLEIDGQMPEFMRAQDRFALYVASLRGNGAKRR